MANQSEKRRVLIADDEPDARAIISAAVAGSDRELVLCRDGDECLEICKQRLPDLALIDIQMPGKDGIELCRWIKENSGRSFVPVLLITSRTEIDDKLNGLESGADDYITKPFSVPELAARVRGFFRIKSLTEDLQRTQDLLREKEKELLTVQLAGAAAHELGQPLTAIMLNCELLLALKDARERKDAVIASITAECCRVREVLTKLRELDRLQLKPYARNMEILDLSTRNPIRCLNDERS